MKKNILVFPCGSEVGLEIYRSLEYSRHLNLIGGSSVDDHGKFVFENYFGNFPFISKPNFVSFLKTFIEEHKIDAIYPAMDMVISFLKPLESQLNCKIISSPVETSKICSSKKETYTLLDTFVNIPKLYSNLSEINSFPVFIKPNIGFGSRGAKLIESLEEGESHLKAWGDCIISDYLPGEEYTVDCFTNRQGELMFAGPRPRRRTRTGISVNTISIDPKERKDFKEIAEIINSKLEFRGAWFFQVKRDINNQLSLMEVASRMGGSSLLYRYKGINFALLSVFDAFDYDVNILENNFNIEIDRALNVVVKMDYEFDKVYVDFDDCLVLDGKVNIKLVAKIYQWINEEKNVYLITRHEFEINESLAKYRLSNLFDEVIHIKNKDRKSKYIEGVRAIFIDDSYVERNDVSITHGIPVFAPDMIN